MVLTKKFFGPFPTAYVFKFRKMPKYSKNFLKCQDDEKIEVVVKKSGVISVNTTMVSDEKIWPLLQSTAQYLEK